MSLFSLMYWLGPWVDQRRSPRNIRRESHVFHSQNESHPLWVYAGGRSKHPLFLLPGIQHQGPDDPRLDRFARVLAQAGYTVGVPALSTMIGLRMEPELLEDARQAFLAFSERFKVPVAVFSISASSIAALHVATHETTAPYVSQLMTFGGYYSWSEALSFAIDGVIEPCTTLCIDPLNLPVVLLNVIEDLAVDDSDRAMLYAAWHQFVCTVWEDPNYNDISAFGPVAENQAKRLPKHIQSVFLKGCSVVPGGVELARSAIKDCSRNTGWLDPNPALHALKCPLHIAHGREDVVVPYTHAHKIAKQVEGAQVYITGLAHHTGVHGLRHYWTQIPLLFMELIRGFSLIRAMSHLWRA